LKGRATLNRYFEEFEQWIEMVDKALLHFSHCPDEITTLMGLYCKTLREVAEVAQSQNFILTPIIRPIICAVSVQ